MLCSEQAARKSLEVEIILDARIAGEFCDGVIDLRDLLAVGSSITVQIAVDRGEFHLKALSELCLPHVRGAQQVEDGFSPSGKSHVLLLPFV